MSREQVRLSLPVVEHLAQRLRGEVVRPDDPGYKACRRVWNGSIDRRPALVVRCAGVADVRAALEFARAHDLLVAVRGGGHSFPGSIPPVMTVW